MSNFVIEIQAPTIVAVIEKLIAAIAPRAVAPTQPPQTPAEQAVRQQVVPAPTYAPAPIPTAQPPIYVAPAQKYQPSAPINPTSAAPMSNSQTMGAVTMASAVAPAPVQHAPIVPSTNPAPVAAAPTYLIDDLARAAAQLMDAGKQQDLLALLSQFGVKTLGQIPPEQFGAFATALRQMGANI